LTAFKRIFWLAQPRVVLHGEVALGALLMLNTANVAFFGQWGTGLIGRVVVSNDEN
jgi:hypothetical protein